MGSPELAQTVVDAGAIAHLAQMILNPDAKLKRQVFSALSQISKHSVDLAEMVVEAEIFPAVLTCLRDPDEYVRKKVVAVANVLPRLLALYLATTSSEDLQMKSKKALKNILQKCVHLPALEPLLHDAPSNILKHVVGQFSKVLPHDSKARRIFVTSGGLKKVQEIKAEPGTALYEYITSINNCFPEEIVKYYSPGYSDALLERVEQYIPTA